MTPSLPLRDVHAGVAPPWWPPAPGWWMLLLAALLLASAFAWWRLRRRRRRLAILQVFDATIDQAGSPSQQVAAMSELLRRAARRKDPTADRLDGEPWLRFLDEGMPRPVFSEGVGALLLDGGFRADVTDQQAAALRLLARDRYQRWMHAG